MSVSKVFILRPIMTTLLYVAVTCLGILGYRSLPFNALPNVDFPVIQITASYPGASAETIAKAIAQPIERQLTQIQGLEVISSKSSEGMTQITLEFNLDRPIDAAAQDVSAALTAAAAYLPSDLPTPPVYTKINPAEMPIFYLALRSSSLPLYALDKYAEDNLINTLSTIPGVAKV